MHIDEVNIFLKNAKHSLFNEGQRLQYIKLINGLTGVGLKESKVIVDKLVCQEINNKLIDLKTMIVKLHISMEPFNTLTEVSRVSADLITFIESLNH